jgi:hypothetical protein
MRNQAPLGIASARRADSTVILANAADAAGSGIRLAGPLVLKARGQDRNAINPTPVWTAQDVFDLIRSVGVRASLRLQQDDLSETVVSLGFDWTVVWKDPRLENGRGLVPRIHIRD